jgi:predicted  nucleic acid-binding Zn-ribbon protein
MRALVENLYALQQLVNSPVSAERDARVQALRDVIPAPVLSHFDRLLTVGRKGVSVVRDGICRQCHLRVPSGTAASLARPKDLFICDNCGAYLYVPLEEIPASGNSTPPVNVAPVPAPAKKPRRKAVVAAQ